MTYQRTRYRNVYRRGEVLYYRIRDEHGEWRERRYGIGQPRDARDAQEAGQSRADAVRAGIADPRLEAMAEYAQRPIDAAIDEYCAHLTGKGNCNHHVEKCTRRFLNRWAKECRVGRLSDANATTLNRWLSEMPRSPRTKNAYRTAILAMLRWSVDYGRMAYNPCPSGLVPKFNEKIGRVRISRAISQTEFASILAVAPAERRAFYVLAGLMALRWREVARLRWGDLDFDAMVAILPAGQTKNRQQAELPIIAKVLDELMAIKPDGAGSRDLIFAGEVQYRTWKADLERAGVPFEDDRGYRADRKCLRKSFNTWLKEAGVALVDAQRLMRHHSPELTANIYTDVRLAHLHSAASTAFQHEPPQGKEQERTETPEKSGTRTA